MCGGFDAAIFDVVFCCVMCILYYFNCVVSQVILDYYSLNTIRSVFLFLSVG